MLTYMVPLSTLGWLGISVVNVFGEGLILAIHQVFQSIFPGYT